MKTKILILLFSLTAPALVQCCNAAQPARNDDVIPSPVPEERVKPSTTELYGGALPAPYMPRKDVTSTHQTGPQSRPEPSAEPLIDTPENESNSAMPDLTAYNSSHADIAVPNRAAGNPDTAARNRTPTHAHRRDHPSILDYLFTDNRINWITPPAVQRSADNQFPDLPDKPRETD